MVPAIIGSLYSGLRSDAPPIIFNSIKGLTIGYAPFIAVANHLRNSSPKVCQVYDKIVMLLVTIDFGLWATDLGALIDLLDRKYSFYKLVGTASFEIVGNGVFLGWIVAVALMVNYINNKLYTHDYVKTVKQIPRDNGNTIDFYKPTHEYGQQFFYITRMTLSIALTVFALQSPVFCAVNLVCLSYSLWKVSKQQWMNLTRTFDGNEPDVLASRRKMDPKEGWIKSVTAEYQFPLLLDQRPQDPKNPDPCPMCLDVNTPPNNPRVYYCPDKSYHVGCLPQYYFINSTHLLANWEFSRHIERTNSNVTITYPSSIPRDNLPHCPDCNRSAFVNRLYLAVTENTNKGLRVQASGQVTLREPIPLPGAIPEEDDVEDVDLNILFPDDQSGHVRNRGYANPPYD